MKLEFFKDKGFRYDKWYIPIGSVYSHRDDIKGTRIYETYRLLTTPIGSVRLLTRPHIQ
jgi:hypothetical protein